MNIEELILKNHPLAAYCTFKIGGPADFFLEAKSTEEVLSGLQWAKEKGLRAFVFGGGSNLLFDDAGFRGLVIRVKSSEIRVEGSEIVADAGVPSAVLVHKAMEAGLSGLEAWAGLPGTVGGAVFGNAGCFGVETKDILKEVTLYNPEMGVRHLEASELGYGYRNSQLKEAFLKGLGEVILEARFTLKKGDAATIVAGMKEIVKKRALKQPPGLNTGSFFKNPSPEQPAGMLIDQAGLKGFQIGGMKISDQHGNFFLNTGGASSKDVLALCEHVQKVVLERFGLRLEREVVLVV